MSNIIPLGNIPPEAISAIVNLGIRLATTAIERRAQRPLTEMTAADVLRVVSEIEVRGVDELIEEGRKRVGQSRAEQGSEQAGVRTVDVEEETGL